MKIYLLRHGSSVANENKLVCGAKDYPLSSTGIRQAESVCKVLTNIRFDRIYTSPLSRARNTIINLVSSIEPIIQEELMELDTGLLSEMKLPDLWEQDERFRKPWLWPDMRYPSGESFREMTSRITKWIKVNLEVWGSEETVLISGHEGTLRTIYMHLMDLSLDNYPDFTIGNCDHLIFNIDDGAVTNFTHNRYETYVS